MIVSKRRTCGWCGVRVLRTNWKRHKLAVHTRKEDTSGFEEPVRTHDVTREALAQAWNQKAGC
jgi:hypothetical protein